MDKRKVISAYRRGFITMQECAQILGIDSVQIMGMMNDPQLAETPRTLKQTTASV
ncbi:hypothetical protein ACFFK0_20810 [Paenibacillus chartarius]|uniref:Uncharacterized protein n=1 Tax=Paenibacillus chartarius TaxID=747481 RepID=A0ABV6DQB9_9BACL